MSRDDTRFTDIDRLAGSVPDRVISQLLRRGIVTCEQAYAAVWRLRDKAEEADTDLTTAETTALLAAIEKILPDDTIQHLKETPETQWTQTHPLGVLPPENQDPDESESGDHSDEMDLDEDDLDDL
ncbi:MAG: hypothetical protein KAJ37_09750 [Candidatus Krumholzibacteria bacterium]|nr:hypothetical protein [Candidatus Krumholzibacteria bacterium]